MRFLKLQNRLISKVKVITEHTNERTEWDHPSSECAKTTSRVQYEIAYHVGRYVSSSTAS